MNKTLLSLYAGCALFALSSASANVLYSEDWSSYTVGSAITSGGDWTLGGATGGSTITIVEENGIKAAHASFGTAVLPFASTNQSFALGTGLSFEVTLMMKSPASNYFRFGFLDTSIGTAPGSNNMFNTVFAAERADLQFGGGNAGVPATARYTYNSTTTPFDQFVTYRFDVVPLGDGRFALSLYFNDTLVAFAEQERAIFGGESPSVVPYIQFRSAVDAYISNITISQIPPVPEPSHFAIGAGVAALLFTVCRRRR